MASRDSRNSRPSGVGDRYHDLVEHLRANLLARRKVLALDPAGIADVTAIDDSLAMLQKVDDDLTQEEIEPL